MGDSNSNYDAPFHYIQRKIDDGPHEKMGAIQGSTYAPREVLILGRLFSFSQQNAAIIDSGKVGCSLCGTSRRGRVVIPWLAVMWRWTMATRGIVVRWWSLGGAEGGLDRNSAMNDD